MTSRAALLSAARGVGLAELTVGKVADRCGVKYSTVYRHWSGIDALVAAYVDQVVTEFLPSVQSLEWRPHLERLASRLGAAVDAERGLRDALSRLPEPERLREARETSVAVLTAAGFSDSDAAEGAAAVVAGAVWCPFAVPLLLDGLTSRLAAGDGS